MPLPPSKPRNRIKLSRQDMCGISQTISRDFSPRFFRSKASSKSNTQFSAQELLEISRQISREYAPPRSGESSKVVLLTVSPKRLHAYWHIAKPQSSQTPESIELQQAMTLRIYAEHEEPTPEATPAHAPPNWIDIPIIDVDGHRDINLPAPKPSSPPPRYLAALGQIRGDLGFVPLAYSNTATPPLSPSSPSANQLVNILTRSIMPSSTPASSQGKSASGQGK
ncbi:MAG: DUF4912 domain-containing protein [Methylomonas sp.]|nr:DUF4912 domain-containing protein [Methylomonas sp.]